jgi:glycosyltransferase involved in cell wall biosynthesis
MLHFIQETATPHNNVLLAALKKTRGLKLQPWYCQPKAAKYGWKDDLSNAVVPARFYANGKIDFAFLRQVLKNSNDKILLVGWSNPSTRALFILLCLLRRRFGMWFDCPQDSAPRSKLSNLLRESFYLLLRTSNATVFCVGKMTVEYFAARGFNRNQLVNLPILVEVNKTRADFAKQRPAIRKRYNAGKQDILLTAGSRLVFDKGFDILLTAIAALPPAQKKRVRCVIVGQGEELENLKRQAAKSGLAKQVYFPGWLAIEDFHALMAAGDIFTHPARFDAWGSTIFAHAIGVPVIGSTGAGSAADRIEPGKNGWLFNPEKPRELTQLIQNLFKLKPADFKKLSANARKTAEQWLPATGARIIKENLA